MTSVAKDQQLTPVKSWVSHIKKEHSVAEKNQFRTAKNAKSKENAVSNDTIKSRESRKFKKTVRSVT